MTAYFVTGTGTEIGKTQVMQCLLTESRQRGIPARGIKPVLSGFDATAPAHSDSGKILTAMETNVTPETIAAISPWRYAAPLAPSLAARREGKQLSFREIIAFCRDQSMARGTLYIEGAGGIMSPLTDEATNLDLIVALGLPVLLVGGTYLGAISHLLTAASALMHLRQTLSGIILNASAEAALAPEELREVLQPFLHAQPITAPVALLKRLSLDANGQSRDTTELLDQLPFLAA